MIRMMENGDEKMTIGSVKLSQITRDIFLVYVVRAFQEGLL